MNRPRPDSAAYQAAAIIHASGPQSAPRLIAQINFGPQPSHKLRKIESAAASGWLVEVGGTFFLGDEARAFFDGIEKPIKKFVGQVAAPRLPITPLYAVKPLSKRFMPSSKGFRDDVPDYSVRDKMSFRTVAGGQP
jgi:hypothetical protein